MDMEPLLLAGIAGIIFLGGIIQGAIGFAYALFVTPILVWMGVSLPDTIVIVATCSFVQSGMATLRLRRELPWRPVAWAVAVRLPAMVAGVLLLRELTLFPIDTVKLVLGCLICLLVTLQIACKVTPVDRLHPGWGAVAFLSSGFLTGVSGMGGPPLVMWVMAHDWSSVKTRVFLFAIMTASFPLQLGLLYGGFGAGILKGLLLGLLLTPAVFLGSRIGIPLGNSLPKPLLRNVAYLVLIAIGIGAIVQPLFRLF